MYQINNVWFSNERIPNLLWSHNNRLTLQQRIMQWSQEAACIYLDKLIFLIIGYVA